MYMCSIQWYRNSLSWLSRDSDSKLLTESSHGGELPSKPALSICGGDFRLLLWESFETKSLIFFFVFPIHCILFSVLF